MTRLSSPIDPADGPLEEFAAQLRSLRDQMGSHAPGVDEISEREGLPRSTLYAALNGHRLPRREVVAAFARSWGADEADWLAKRAAVEAELADQPDLSAVLHDVETYQHPKAAGLSSSANLLRSTGARRAYESGDLLCRQGDPSDTVWLVEEGIVKVTQTSDTTGTLLLAVRGSGDLVGERGALDERQRGANLVAATHLDTVKLSAEQFRSLMAANTHLALDVAHLLSQRLSEADTRRAELITYPATTRLARLLLQLSLQYGQRRSDDAMILDLPLVQDELATLIGASSIATQRALKSLRTAGIIDTRYRAIRILAPDRLLQLDH